MEKHTPERAYLKSSNYHKGRPAGILSSYAKFSEKNGRFISKIKMKNKIKYLINSVLRRSLSSGEESGISKSSNTTPTQRDNGMSFIEVKKKKAVKGFPILEYWKSKNIIVKESTISKNKEIHQSIQEKIYETLLSIILKSYETPCGWPVDIPMQFGSCFELWKGNHNKKVSLFSNGNSKKDGCPTLVIAVVKKDNHVKRRLGEDISYAKECDNNAIPFDLDYNNKPKKNLEH
ncbi:hypothetical protein H8356DRAFT_1353813 [Neocallimastix lanati (nom. inval.)]|nr:hypothetical protein H8356DRAFT_1353813 [Neocallimastix sp. JGI-2020a]